MVRSPWTLTSPLNLPAMRTLPPPSILPSMVMSAAISDSWCGRPVAARATGATARLGAYSGSGSDGASNTASSLVSGTGAGTCRKARLSFHLDMGYAYQDGELLRLTLKAGEGN